MKEVFIQKLKIGIIPCKENNYRANILKPDFLFSLIFIFFLMRIIVVPLYCQFPQSIFFAKIVSSEIMQLLNSQRQDLGIDSLKENPQLTMAAELKAQDMLNNDYFSHTSPTGIPAWHWIKEAGYSYQVAGENLAIGFLDSSEVHQAWNNSPLHKQNLLDERFQEIGIAVLTGDFQGRETTIVVQLFGNPNEKTNLVEKITPVAEASVEHAPDIEIPQEVSENVSLVDSIAENQIKDVILEPESKISKIEELDLETIEQAKIEKQTLNALSKTELEFWRFFANQYNQTAQQIVLLASGFGVFILTLNLLIIFKLPLSLASKLAIIRESFPRAALTITTLVLLGLTDSSLLVQLIPHTLKI